MSAPAQSPTAALWIGQKENVELLTWVKEQTDSSDFPARGFLFSDMIKTNGSEEEANARLNELELRHYQPESCA